MPAPLLRATLVAAIALAGCNRGTDPTTIVAFGHVEATDVRISTKVGGRLDSFGVQEGDKITRGQPIAQLDTTDARLMLRQARAEREQAAAELRLRQAGSRREDVAELEALVAQDAADLAGAERDLARMQGLLDRGSGTAKARDDARTRRDVSAQRLAARKQSLARARSGSRPQEIDAARARVGSSAARIAQWDQQIEDATVESPVSGVVTEKIAEAGEILQPGSGLCVVTNLDEAWLTVYVAEPDLGRLRLGQDVEVKTDDGQTRRGKITFVASRAEFTPKNVQTRDERVKLVFKVKVGLDNEDGLFKPGMPAEARIPAIGSAQ
jgi:HlyD family secretion protein